MGQLRIFGNSKWDHPYLSPLPKNFSAFLAPLRTPRTGQHKQHLRY